eukprot:3670496-Rhodomonas_salina.1
MAGSLVNSMAIDSKYCFQQGPSSFAMNLTALGLTRSSHVTCHVTWGRVLEPPIILTIHPLVDPKKWDCHRGFSFQVQVGSHGPASE